VAKIEVPDDLVALQREALAAAAGVNRYELEMAVKQAAKG
jgi:hypothetical protein